MSPGAPPSTPRRPPRTSATGMAAVRVSFTWLGTRKSLSAEQRDEAAQPFDADGSTSRRGRSCSTRGTRRSRRSRRSRSKIASTWKCDVPAVPRAGRAGLIRRDQIDEFVGLMEAYRGELRDAVANLDRHYGELKATAAERLGRLFNPADYPETLVGLVRRVLGLPELSSRPTTCGTSTRRSTRRNGRESPPGSTRRSRWRSRRSRRSSPSWWRHLTERISGTGEDGERKVFRDSAVGNLQEFFARFRSLNVGSNDQLDELVAQAQQAVRGVAAKDLRGSSDLRQRVATDLSRVQSALDGMLVDRPRRRILRTPPKEES